MSNVLRREKRKYLQNIYEEAQDFVSHNTKNLHKNVNSLSKGYRYLEKALRNNDGMLITQNSKITNKSADYFNQLLNYNISDRLFQFESVTTNNANWSAMSKEEIYK